MTNPSSLHRKDSHAHEFWCRNHAGQEFTFEEYIDFIKSFHGHPAPGLIIGGKMVDMALTHIPPNTLFDAICETTNCLPDAIQLLTPCTAGNNWMKIIHLGRFALSLYDKYKGSGVRVFLDTEKLKEYNVSTLVFFGMIFAMRSGREKIILSDLKNPPDRLKKYVPDGRQFLCHKKPKLKHYK